MRKKTHGIRCIECGAHLDPGERCDCERITAEKRTAEQKTRTRKIVAQNLRVIEQAQREWDYA